MNATEAKALTRQNLRTGLLKPLRDYVDLRIKDATQAGRSQLNHPFRGYPAYPSIELQEALWQSLREDGFTVIHHPNPDPGHPCSSAYDSVSW